MNIRALSVEDAELFNGLRLQGLREHPEAFGSAYEDESEAPLQKVIDRLSSASADHTTFGSFVGSDLVGAVHFNRYVGRKIRHRAMLGGMYVAPAHRGRGIGRALLNAVLVHAQAQSDLETLILAVTVGNEAARNLYQSVGFVPSHVEKGYIKWAGRYYDIEWMTLGLQPSVTPQPLDQA